MTRKDYAIIAGAISRLEATRHERWILADTLCDSFKEDNPRFDRELFLTACGLRGNLEENG